MTKVHEALGYTWPRYARIRHVGSADVAHGATDARSTLSQHSGGIGEQSCSILRRAVSTACSPRSEEYHGTRVSTRI